MAYRIEQTGTELQGILNDAAVTKQGLEDEVARAQAAEGVLQENIDSEAGERQSADALLAGNIGTEVARAQQAESDLGVRVDANAAGVAAEVARAQEAEGQVWDTLNDEILTRQSQDAALQVNIEREAGLREAGDGQLQGEIYAISEKIPAEASEMNQLADKQYVQEAIEGTPTREEVAAIEAVIPAAASENNKLVDTATFEAAIDGKQDTLTFDEEPTEGSENPVTSGGVASAVATLQGLYAELRDGKADKATTLAGYGIEDAYTKGAVDEMIGALSRNEVVVGALPQTGEEGVIYRVPGNGYYTDYMYYDGSFVELAQYSMEFDQTQVGYFTCDTAAGTAAKTVSAAGYTLAVGGNIRIKMTNANAAANATLNINGAGAKALYYNGEQASASNSWEAGEVLEVYYDGTQYQCASGGGGEFASGEKVKNTGITGIAVEGSADLMTSGGVYDATSLLRYDLSEDISSGLVQQHIDSQYSVYFNKNGVLAATGYATAYLIDVNAGDRIRITNSQNTIYHPRILYFNGDTLVSYYMVGDLPDEPIVVTIPDGVNRVGINRSSRAAALVVERLITMNKIDGESLVDGSVSLDALGTDVKGDLMSDDSDKYKLLQAVCSDTLPVRETILQYELSSYTTSFPSAVSVLGREKYDNPIEIIGFRIHVINAQTGNIFVYDTQEKVKVVSKDVSLSAGENIVYLDTPHYLGENEVAGVSASFAGQFDNNRQQVGFYALDLSTGELTPNKRNCYAYTVIYRSSGEGERSSVLYTKDFTTQPAGDDWIGTIDVVSTGATISVDSPVYLNRSYASEKTVRMVCILHSDTVVKLGYKNKKTGAFDYVGVVDCANGKISVGAVETAIAVVDGNRYAIDLIKEEYVATLRVTDYKSGAAVSAESWIYTQNDWPALCLTGGTSPLIEIYAILSRMAEPYIMFFGDSITDGAQTPMYNGQFLARFGDMIGKKTGKPYLVSGRAGSTITYIVDEIDGRLFTEARLLRPKYAFVTIGTNGGNTEQNLTTLVRKMIDYGIKVILNNVPNRTYNGTEVDITETNDVLQQVREVFGLSGVHNELACSVNNDGVTTNTEMFGAAEGGYVIHPNGEGHYQIYLRTFIDCPEIYTDAGVLPVPDEVLSGTTSDRPADAKIGDIYFDTTLGYHVWSCGQGIWKDKNGVVR